MSSNDEGVAKRSVGRPRDPLLENRAHAAVLSIYAERGLDGLNFNSVAREASLGKVSLYSRWDTVEELLIDALEASIEPPRDVETGSIEDDLIHIATDLWRHYSSPVGMVSVRINLDAAVVPELAGPYRGYIREFQRVIRSVVRRAAERGELKADVDPLVVLDLVLGAVMLRAMFTQDRASVSDAEVEKMARGMVGSALDGIRRR